LVKVVAAGIAPSLLVFWHLGHLPLLPMTLGHEISGVVEEVGPGVARVQPGDRVRVHPNLTCRACEYCLTDREPMCIACSMIGSGVFGPDAMPLYQRYHEGGLAEYVRAPAWSLDALPHGVSFAVGSKVHDIANGLRALKLAQLRQGATLLVTAATGAVGSATLRMAHLFGATRVIAVARSRERLITAQTLSELPVDVVALDELPDQWEAKQGLTAAIRELAPQGVDAVIDYFPPSTGAATWQSIAAMRTGATAVIIGGNVAPVPVPTNVIMFNCWRIVGSRNCTRVDAREVLDLIAGTRLRADDLITHRYSLREVNSAIQAMQERAGRTWMIVVEPEQPRVE
jgi:threonine dehydrogenase-like Zn-dependent dehydrogenase